MSTHLDTLQRVITDVVAPAATTIDEQGTFPSAGIEALGEARILGLTAGTDRDSLAARVMAQTTEALLDFVGRAISGLPLRGPTQS